MATATPSNVLDAQPRTPGNKNAARRVRVAGKVPAIVYGAGKDAVSVSRGPAAGEVDSSLEDWSQHDF